jgi:hypothetical protein
MLIQVAKFSEIFEHRLADLGDERSDIIITDILDANPLRSTINPRVDAVRAK